MNGHGETHDSSGNPFVGALSRAGDLNGHDLRPPSRLASEAPGPPIMLRLTTRSRTVPRRYGKGRGLYSGLAHRR